MFAGFTVEQQVRPIRLLLPVGYQYLAAAAFHLSGQSFTAEAATDQQQLEISGKQLLALGVDKIAFREYTCTRIHWYVRSMVQSSLRVRSCTQRVKRCIAPSILTALLAMAGLILPEQPQLQEQICLQYSSATACRVW